MLETDITNGTSGPIVITQFFAQWLDSPPSQSLDRLSLQSVVIWNRSDPDAPSDIPSEGAWQGSLSDRMLPAMGVRAFTIQFGGTLQPGDYQVHLVFGTGCQVIQSVTLP
jgi:hypothetical protein